MTQPSGADSCDDLPPPPISLQPRHYLMLFLVVLTGVYLLVFMTGKQTSPKLGIDLEGGT